MENSVFFSVIVPVYRVEKYLHLCVDSVLGQKYVEYELILVDDGSPDSCPAICEDYARSDNRVSVIHKSNGGLSSARNAGIIAAKGDYICFLDADDYWIDDCVLTRLASILKKDRFDAVTLRYACLYEKNGRIDLREGTLPKELENAALSYDECLRIMVANQLFGACAWDKVVRRELFKNYDLTFREGIIGEDIDWTARLALAAKSITVLPDPVYVYRKGRPGAITSKLTGRNLVDTKNSLERVLHYSELSSRTSTFLWAYYSYTAYRYMIWMAESAAVDYPQKTDFNAAMQEYKWLFRYDDIKKVRMTAKLCSIIGWDMTARVLGLYLKNRGSR